MMARHDVQSLPLHDQVIRKLMGDIVNEAIPAGTMLPPINALSAQLGVSQTIVRQALKVLAAKGMVEIRHGVGSCVLDEHRWNALDPQILQTRSEEGKLLPLMRQLLEVRRVLEVELAGLATNRVTNDDLRLMAVAIERQGQCLRDPERFVEADDAFHQVLLRAAQNDILRSVMGCGHELFLHICRLTLVGDEGGLAERAVTQHRMILDAVVAGDPGDARKVMLQHIVTTEENLLHYASRPSVTERFTSRELA
jgi:DNA-binding FadR family transcriptional regulator